MLICLLSIYMYLEETRAQYNQAMPQLLFLDQGGLLLLGILWSSEYFPSCAGGREKWLGDMDKGLSF